MLGTVALAAAKCVENMELAHNVIHGQWDWMNDPEIHSSHLGMGHGRALDALAVLAQPSTPYVHQRHRRGR